MEMYALCFVFVCVYVERDMSEKEIQNKRQDISLNDRCKCEGIRVISHSFLFVFLLLSQSHDIMSSLILVPFITQKIYFFHFLFDHVFLFFFASLPIGIPSFSPFCVENK